MLEYVYDQTYHVLEADTLNQMSDTFRAQNQVAHPFNAQSAMWLKSIVLILITKSRLLQTLSADEHKNVFREKPEIHKYQIL